MQKDELVFSADCVINLDQFGQFKDYSDTLQQILFSFSQNSPDLSLLKEILQADRQDLFHLQNFHNVVKKMIEKEDLIIKLEVQGLNKGNQRENLRGKLVKLYLEILQQSFFSFAGKEDLIQAIIQRMQFKNTGKVSSYEVKVEVLRFLYKLAPSLNYISTEDLNKLLPIFMAVSEKECADSKDADRYVLVVDYFLRSREFRKILNNNQIEMAQKELENLTNGENFIFLRFKMALWKKQNSEALKYLRRMKQVQTCKHLSMYIQSWERIFKQKQCS